MDSRKKARELIDLFFDELETSLLMTRIEQYLNKSKREGLMEAAEIAEELDAKSMVQYAKGNLMPVEIIVNAIRAKAKELGK